MMEPRLSAAYDYCLSLARLHYENFPVASRILPADRRPAIAAVYAFARLADDMADEGTLDEAERLRQLDDWQKRLDHAVSGSAEPPVFEALMDTMARYSVPPQLFSDLLVAFRQDVTKRRYESFADLLSYCRCSANPVGRIVLHVFNEARAKNLLWSDAICTALQLANFWQDISVDNRKGRIYAPLEDLARFRYTPEEIGQNVEDERFRGLMQFEVERTCALFREGAPIVRNVSKPLRFELALTWHGGMRILQLIKNQGYRVLSARPKLGTYDGLLVVLRSILKTPQ